MSETVISAAPVQPSPPSPRRAWLPSLTLGVAIVALLLGGAGVAFGIAATSQQATLSSQVAAANRRAAAEAREITTMQRRESSLLSQATAITSKLSGTAADVITCGDLQNLGLQTYWQDSNYNLQSTDIPLPNHCINH